MLDDPVEELSLQLVKLVRGLRGMHVAAVEAGGQHVEPATLGLLARLAATGPTRPSTLPAGTCTGPPSGSQPGGIGPVEPAWRPSRRSCSSTCPRSAARCPRWRSTGGWLAPATPTTTGPSCSS